MPKTTALIHQVPGSFQSRTKRIQQSFKVTDVTSRDRALTSLHESNIVHMPCRRTETDPVGYGEFGDRAKFWPEFGDRPPEWSQWNRWGDWNQSYG